MCRYHVGFAGGEVNLAEQTSCYNIRSTGTAYAEIEGSGYRTDCGRTPADGITETGLTAVSVLLVLGRVQVHLSMMGRWSSGSCTLNITRRRMGGRTVGMKAWGACG